MRRFKHFRYYFLMAFIALFVFSGPGFGADVSIPKMMTWTSYDVGSSGYMQVGYVSAALFEKYGIKIRIIPAGTDIPRVYPVRLKDAEVASC